MGNKAAKIERMATESIPRLILKYSASTFFALFFNELYNIIDTLFVCKGIGDDAMGGVSIIFPFMLIQGAISQTIGSGAATIVSKHLGAKNYEQAGNTTAHAMLAFYSVSLTITVLGLLFINPLLKIFGATNEIMPFAKEYFTIILMGNIFSTGFSSIIRAEGKMLYALIIWLVPTAVNISLDALFIYVLHFGVRGTAFATVISYFISFVMWIVFIKKLSVQSFRSIKINLKEVKSIIQLGIPMLIQLGSVSVLFTFINKALSLNGGTININTFAYISKIISFAIVPFHAVAMAASPVISYNHGARNERKISKAYKSSITLCEVYALLALILSFTVPGYALKIFTDNPDIIEQGIFALKALALSLPFLPVIITTGTYFQATEQKVKALLTNSLILIFACIFILIFLKAMHVQSIYYAVSAACLVSCMISFILKFTI